MFGRERGRNVELGKLTPARCSSSSMALLPDVIMNMEIKSYDTVVTFIIVAVVVVVATIVVFFAFSKTLVLRFV